MHFHLAHIVPDKTKHGLNGYKEVIDTLQWGLRELGHVADYGLNQLSSRATNIIFGAQMLSPEAVTELPPETIVYNLEQNKGLALDNVKPSLRATAKTCRIWDYSSENLQFWSTLGASDVRILPIGYAPILRRIARPEVQDIDVLIYGAPGANRLEAFRWLSLCGLTSIFVCGLYGKARDELIGRSKIVVNINMYSHSKIFELVRVSYLLANQKAVVAEIESDTSIEVDIRSGIHQTTGSELVQDCLNLASDKAARLRLEEVGFAAFSQRDIRPMLQHALANATVNADAARYLP